MTFPYSADHPGRLHGWLRRPYAAMLALALLAVWAGLSPPLISPVHGAQATPEQEAADQRVMGKIRTEIEAIPEAMREFEGIEILEKSLPGFALPATQQRVLLSIGELSAKLGGSDKSIDAFQRGLALAADPFLTMTCRNRLAEELSKAGRGNEAIAVLATVPEPDAEAASPSDLPPNQTDDVYEAERKRIELLIDQGKDEEGFARILRFAKAYPRHKETPLILFEHITGPMFVTGNFTDSIRWRRRFIAALPYAADDPNFLSNGIAELNCAGRTDEAMKAEATAAMIAFVNRFPNDTGTATHYSTLAGYEHEKGNLDAARDYCRQAIATGKAMSQSTEVFEINLAQLEGRSLPPPQTPIAKAPSDQNPRFWLLVANGTAVVVLLTWYVWRRWAHPRATH